MSFSNNPVIFQLLNGFKKKKVVNGKERFLAKKKGREARAESAFQFLLYLGEKANRRRDVGLGASMKKSRAALARQRAREILVDAGPFILQVPVQRVTKYPLLLNRLHKVTPTHHPDKDDIKTAQDRIEAALEQMNKVSQ